MLRALVLAATLLATLSATARPAASTRPKLLDLQWSSEERLDGRPTGQYWINELHCWGAECLLETTVVSPCTHGLFSVEHKRWETEDRTGYDVLTVSEDAPNQLALEHRDPGKKHPIRYRLEYRTRDDGVVELVSASGTRLDEDDLDGAKTYALVAVLSPDEFLQASRPINCSLKMPAMRAPQQASGK